MVWIFLRGKSGSRNTAAVLWLGKEQVQSIQFFSLRWVQEKGLMVWGCAFIFLAVLVSLMVGFFFLMSFSGFEPL